MQVKGTFAARVYEGRQSRNLLLNMNTRFLLTVVASTIMFSTASLSAQPNLQQMLKDTAVAAHWIYDDYTQAVARATASGKPLLVTLRCVP
jgi:hypothetical protein